MNVSCLPLRNYSDTATSKGQGWELFWHFDFRELNCDYLDFSLSLWFQRGPVGQVLYSRSVPSWWDMPRLPVHVVADGPGDCKGQCPNHLETCGEGSSRLFRGHSLKILINEMLYKVATSSNPGIGRDYGRGKGGFRRQHCGLLFITWQWKWLEPHEPGRKVHLPNCR